MKPEAIDDELWDEVYDVYVQDMFDIGVRDFFEEENPAALEEMTAVMMETARKGMWEASDEQLKAIAQLHTELIEKHKPSCSGFVCNNIKLQEYISSQVSSDMAHKYEQNIRDIRETSVAKDKSMVLKREEMNSSDKVTTVISNTLVGVLAIVAIVVLIYLVRRRRKKMEE